MPRAADAPATAIAKESLPPVASVPEQSPLHSCEHVCNGTRMVAAETRATRTGSCIELVTVRAIMAVDEIAERATAMVGTKVRFVAMRCSANGRVSPSIVASGNGRW